jgi:hypothetical protein
MTMKIAVKAMAGGAGWRVKYKIHAAADAFPMMEGKELAELVKDIKTNGLKTAVTVDKNGDLLDGRNRLQALELAGVDLRPGQTQIYHGKDPVAFIISANIHRRHLTKQERSDLITEALKAAEKAKPEVDKPRHDGEVSGKGGRGKVNRLKARVVEECKKHGISKRTAERSLAKGEGKWPSRPKCHRRTKAEVQRKKQLDRLEGFMSLVDAIGMTTIDDSTLDLLTSEGGADCCERVDTEEVDRPTAREAKTRRPARDLRRRNRFR